MAISDDLIPPQALFQATQGLAALDVPVEWHLSAGIGHGIDQKACAMAANFWPADSPPPVNRKAGRRVTFP